MGRSLLVWPVSEPGAISASVRLPEGLWFDVSALFWAAPGTPLVSDGAAKIDVPAALGTSPLLLRSGAVVPLRERPRRATAAMEGDPVSLLVGVGSGSKWGATGELYSDDGETFRHQDSAESLRTRYQLRRSEGGSGEGEQWELSASTMSLAMMAGRETSAATHRLQASLQRKGDAPVPAAAWAGAKLLKVTVLGMEACPSKAEVVSVADGSVEIGATSAEVICEKGEVEEAAPRMVEVRLKGLLAHGDWKVRIDV